MSYLKLIAGSWQSGWAQSYFQLWGYRSALRDSVCTFFKAEKPYEACFDASEWRGPPPRWAVFKFVVDADIDAGDQEREILAHGCHRGGDGRRVEEGADLGRTA